MINLIPIPKKITQGTGSFVIKNNKIKSDFDLPLLNDKVNFCDDADVVIIKNDTINKEGYNLTVSTSDIKIEASTKIGAYYALQSVRKISSYDLGCREVPCCEIIDEPRFAWRGINLDESRHFFGVDEVKRLLDFMFLEKLNVFHWHLTDDQGWRIEIKKYPLLTEIGSKRSNSQSGGWFSFKFDGKPHSGFYTQEQITEIVDYASERGIMVVPEIDFPAHCASAIAPYKYLACREIETEVPTYFGGMYPQWHDFNWHWNRTVCVGKDSTFEFIYNVLDEVCELFNAPYLHMGGDEAPQNEWHKCPKCQALMKREGLSNESQLQGWFENKLNSYLKSKGKQLIAWNDVLKADNINIDDKNIVIQYWTPKRDENAESYINNGGAAILSNHQAFYFDMTYAEIPLDQTYGYTPEAFGINSSNVNNVLGYEGQLWTEWIEDRAKLDLSSFPRLQALSELAWSPKDKINFDDFKQRLDAFKPVYKKLEINYAVDKVSLPANKRKINKIKRKFQRGNPYLETQLNKEYKAKGEF